MKYSLLSKEQFEALHKEFAQFLATQKIDATLWKEYKATNNKIVAEELALFSDMVWDDVLEKVKYLELIITNEIYLFKVKDNQLQLLIIKSQDKSIDFTTKAGMLWMQHNLKSEAIELLQATRNFDTDAKKQELFKWITKGAQITSGELQEAITTTL